MSWFIGVDVGGTFTDFYAFDNSSAREAVYKTASTPHDPAVAILRGLHDLCVAEQIDNKSISRFAHGTTVATNTLIQRKGGRLGFVTTGGFRDLLEIGRQTRPLMFDLKADHPPPLAAREHRFEIAERIGSKGEVVVALSDQAIAELVQQVRDAKLEACAVGLLFSFLNTDHEQRIGAALTQALPDLFVSLSCEVQPEFREYERFSTTALNAYLQPVVSRYVARLEQALSKSAPNAHIGINQSSGGLMSIERARRFPVRTALSGPAAGVVGAIHQAGRSHLPDIITLDMGGTSADVCLIRSGQAELAAGRDVAGLPVRLPMLDINTVGAGGGSIAWFDKDGLLKVGPISAGADPGPACYGKGGDQATVSDANLILGRLSPQGLLGGNMALDIAAAQRVMEPIARRLDTSIEGAARGIIAIVTANMVRALRAVSVERGYDPRTFVLMPFGGAGPLHASDVARALGIRQILVPAVPGILCAQGLIVSDLQENFVSTLRTPVEPDQMAGIEKGMQSLTAQAEDWFEKEGIATTERLLQFALDMRYIGQNYELMVPLTQGQDGRLAKLPEKHQLLELFFAEHRRSYGHCDKNAPVEVVNIRLSAISHLSRPETRPAERCNEPALALTTRRVFFRDDGSADETPIYKRDDLFPGQLIQGPAVIEQLDATTLIYPGDQALVDDVHNLLLEVSNHGA